MSSSFEHSDSDSLPLRPQLPETKHLSDSELFIRAAFEKTADEGFSLLFRRYHAVLCNHAIRYVWDKEVAQDIVSDVFFNCWKNQDFAKINTSYRAYLFGAVRNGCYNYLNRELNRRAPLESVKNWEAAIQRPDQIVQFDELQHKIESIIAQLAPQCKRVFLLSRFEGKKYHEIANELNISSKTVEMHISKALQTIRTALKDEWLIALLLFSLPT